MLKCHDYTGGMTAQLILGEFFNDWSTGAERTVHCPPYYRLADEQERMRNELASKKAEFEKAKAEYKRLTDELRNKTVGMDEHVRQTISSLERKLKERDDETAALKAEVKQLRADNLEGNQEVRRLDQQLSDAKEHMATLEEHLQVRGGGISSLIPLYGLSKMWSWERLGGGGGDQGMQKDTSP